MKKKETEKKKVYTRPKPRQFNFRRLARVANHHSSRGFQAQENPSQ
jgi:hypothetical protein